MVSHAMNLERMVGADKGRVALLPKEGRAENPGAWAEVDRALGVPADGKYGEFKPTQGALAATPEQLAKFDEYAYRAGATPAARNAALEAFHAINRDVMADVEAARNQSKADADAANKQLWGHAYTRKMAAAENALANVDGAKEFDDILKSMGLNDHPAYARVKAAIADLRSEDGAPNNGEANAGGAGQQFTPDAALAERAKLEGDEAFMKRYNSGEDAAIRQMLALNDAIVAGGKH